MKLRVVTYNVHKCRGMDRRVNPARIAHVLREVDADIIALQEVLSVENGTGKENQVRFLAEELQMQAVTGPVRLLRGALYGNVVFSHLPMQRIGNHDITVKGREERGCLHVDVRVDRTVLHVFNVHLGTAFLERRRQGRRLVDRSILSHERLTGPRIVMGDFNEWTRGLTTRLMHHHLKSADVRLHLGRSRTYPGLFPFLHLDHIYYDDSLELEKLTLHRSRTALIASDHLPLAADFRW